MPFFLAVQQLQLPRLSFRLAMRSVIFVVALPHYWSRITSVTRSLLSMMAQQMQQVAFLMSWLVLIPTETVCGYCVSVICLPGGLVKRTPCIVACRRHRE